ncbi:hypothetical protein [Bacillus xiapuensis]|nr:hypothetical protein [Bacillus xiapuensis]
MSHPPAEDEPGSAGRQAGRQSHENRLLLWLPARMKQAEGIV